MVEGSGRFSFSPAFPAPFQRTGKGAEKLRKIPYRTGGKGAEKGGIK